MDDRKVSRIYVQYEDGTAKEATGDDANKIWEHIWGLEVFASVHGMTYSGPCLKDIPVKAATE